MDILNKLAILKKVYDEAERKILYFKDETKISCVYGCGECCNHFEPYTSVLETSIIALYLQQNQARMDHFFATYRNKVGILCPFYDPSRPCHCTIYEIRPMICRLYAFSAKKNGAQLEYSPCPPIKEVFASQVEKAIAMVRRGFPIPVYREEYPKLCEIDFVLATDLHPLTRSLEISIQKWNEIGSEEYQRKQLESKITQRMDIPFSRFVRSHLSKEKPQMPDAS